MTGSTQDIWGVTACYRTGRFALLPFSTGEVSGCVAATLVCDFTITTVKHHLCTLYRRYISTCNQDKWTCMAAGLITLRLEAIVCTCVRVRECECVFHASVGIYPLLFINFVQYRLATNGGRLIYICAPTHHFSSGCASPTSAVHGRGWSLIT